ncbi:MAG: hypothetical protein JW880_04135 [Candidatus Thermoplasmatota archaeon]|nr:hypothetical protein [Candidatus Thermoplasmatota archaeon]
MASGVSERIDRQFRQHIEAKYSPVAKNDHEKLMEALVGLIEYGRDQRQSPHSFLDHAAHLIFRLLAFDEIVIGLYDRKEKNYYNEVVFGYKGDAAIELKRLRYDYEDLVSQKRFPNVKIGKLSEFNPVESLPESERVLFNGAPAGASARNSLDEFRKGDFIDIWMRGPRKDLIGWIEVSHPRNSKLPPKINVLWLELIASICACVVGQRWHQEDRARRRSANER